MEKGQKYYYLKLRSRGVTEHKLFGNKKGVLIYIHEYLQENYIEYEEIKNQIGRYKKFLRATQGKEGIIYEEVIKETLIRIEQLEAINNYKGKDKEQKIYKSINQ